MSTPLPHIAVLPLGKVDPAEVASIVERAVKTLRQPVELRPLVALPAGVENNERQQFRAATLMSVLHEARFRTKSGKMVGAAEGQERPLAKPDLWVYVTDADLFTAKTEGVFSALSRANGTAVVSVKRIREAFYRRPADANKQRVRAVKEVLRMVGRLRGLAECADPRCVMSNTRGVPDLDTKQEMYCRACASVLFKGRIKL